MTTAKLPHVVFILHVGPPRGYWRTAGVGEAAEESYRQHHAYLGDAGPVSGRLLLDGKVARFFGPLGKPGSDT